MAAKRIQRKRSAGWKMPAGAKYVGRPTKFGNPFKLCGDMIYYDASHRRKILSPWVLLYDNGGHTINEVVGLYRDLLFDPETKKHDIEEAIREKFRIMQKSIEELNGKDLACFCNVKNPCHCDPLLEFLNRSKIIHIGKRGHGDTFATKLLIDQAKASGRKILIYDIDKNGKFTIEKLK